MPDRAALFSELITTNTVSRSWQAVSSTCHHEVNCLIHRNACSFDMSPKSVVLQPDAYTKPPLNLLHKFPAFHQSVASSPRSKHCHGTLPGATWIQHTSTTLRTILILSLRTSLCLSKRYILSIFQNRVLFQIPHPDVSHTCYIRCP